MKGRVQMLLLTKKLTIKITAIAATAVLVITLVGSGIGLAKHHKKQTGRPAPNSISSKGELNEKKTSDTEFEDIGEGKYHSELDGEVVGEVEER